MKVAACLTVILCVFALPVTIQLSAEDATDTPDIAQEEITDQPKEGATTATNEDEGHMVTSHFTDLTSAGNTASQSGESTPAEPPMDNHHMSTDDGKNGETNATSAPSVLVIQPTSPSFSAYPSDDETLNKQYREFMQSSDTKNFEQQNDEDTASQSGEFTPTEPPTDNQHMSTDDGTNGETNATSAPSVLEPQNDEDIATIAPKTNDDQSITTTEATLPTVLTGNVDTMQQNGVPNEATFVANYEPDREEMKTEVSEVQEAQLPTTSPPMLLKTPEEFKNNVQWNGEPQKTTAKPNRNDDTTFLEQVRFIPLTDPNNFQDVGRKFIVTPVPPVLEVTTPTNSPSTFPTTPSVEDSLTQLNAEPTEATFNHDGIEPTTPQYEGLISSTGTKNSQEWGGEFSTSTVPPTQEIGTTTSSPPIFTIIPNDDESITQQNAEPTDKTSVLSYDTEVSVTPKYTNLTLHADSKDSSKQDDEFSGVTASSAQVVGVTVNSSSVQFRIVGDDMDVTQQNVEATITTFENDCDDIQSTTPQHEHALSRPGINNSKGAADKISSIKTPIVHDMLQPTNSPSMRLAVPADNENDTRQDAESTGTTHAIYQKDNVTITPSPTPFTVPDDNENIEQWSGQPSVTIISEPTEDEPTTTPLPTRFPMPVHDNNLTFQDDKSDDTIIFNTDKDTHSTMSFLTLFKLLASAKGGIKSKTGELYVTTVLSISEENFSTTTAAPISEEMDDNETKSQEPPNTDRSPDELLVLYEVHARMIKAMSITLAAVVALILATLGCKYLKGLRESGRNAAPPENAGPNDADKPSTSQSSPAEGPRVRFKELLNNEESE